MSKFDLLESIGFSIEILCFFFAGFFMAWGIYLATIILFCGGVVAAIYVGGLIKKNEH